MFPNNKDLKQSENDVFELDSPSDVRWGDKIFRWLLTMIVIMENMFVFNMKWDFARIYLSL